MSLGSDVQLLREAPFFSAFTEEHLRLIAFSAESRTLRKGETMVEAGRPLHSAYLVSSGELMATPAAAARRENTEDEGRRLGRGALIGELALITETRAYETLVATEPSAVLQIRRSVFRRLFDEYPEIAEALRDKLTESLTDTVGRIRDIGKRLSPQEE
ncbi:Crp/Fnr family transcriptional regulator [Afifella sp. IM 167]|uniref:Crp/Fnr family transcriptional regulator n=1 Tax=Afifella sp. IM 167 TaxID=2033586 RepID=UPI001CCA7A3F|nr:cyclic nucleotide-binding domain-containing protein [Afifella sp. IM 167]MBZ8135057.1 hypothetical protein [Afifella sp. IM 167]